MAEMINFLKKFKRLLDLTREAIEALVRDFGRKRTLIEYDAATLGDTVCLIGVINAYKKSYPKESIYLKVSHPEVFYYNRDITLLGSRSFINGFAKIYKLDWRAYPETRNRHIVDNLAEQLRIEINPEQRKPEIFIKDWEVEIFDKKFDFPASRPIVVMAPFSRWKSRSWNYQGWKKVGEYLINKHKAFLIQVGNEKEPFIGIGNDWRGKTDIRTLSILLKKSKMFLSVDNGIHHIAAAVNRPGVVLFGPIQSEYRSYPSITYPAEARSGCRGCFHKNDWSVDRPPRSCPIETYECMNNISIEDIFDTIDGLIKSDK